MHVLLTGAAGFVGAWIADRLAADGHEVVCVVRSSRHDRLTPLGDRISIAEMDLASRRDVRELLNRSKPDAICHAAWMGVAGERRNDASQDANVAIAAELALAAADTGVSVFVGLGSQAEYGPINRIASEDDPCNPTTRYGVAKCQARDAVSRICAASEMRFAWMRIFSLYGPGDNSGWLLPSLIDNLLRGKRPSLTAGEQRWDLLHVEDAARAVGAVLATPDAAGVFNLGSGQAPALRQTLEALRDLIDPELSLGFGEVPYRPDQVMHLQADISRLRIATGWSPVTTLPQGLAEMVAWRRACLDGEG